MDLIHMQGRVYDPTIGRFLQADPFVQAPGQILSYNRYAYVWNNPLTATDPSGFYCQSAGCAAEARDDYKNNVPATKNNAKGHRDKAIALHIH
ncbi:MAG: RHS repeat-associated core domain-containing protein, partial [Reinekea sp.]